MISLLFTLLLFLVYPVSTIWVTGDAKINKIPVSGDKYNINTGAAAWFFSCALLWLITFPYYLYRRDSILRQRKSLATPPDPLAPPIPLAVPEADRTL